MRHNKIINCPTCNDELEFIREGFEVLDHPSGTISEIIPAFYSCGGCDWWINESDVEG